MATPVFAQQVDVRGIQASSGQIVQIDPNTGAILGGFPVPDGVTPSGISGLTFAEGGSTLLYQNNSPGNPANLYRLDPNSGVTLNVHNMPIGTSNRGGLSFGTAAGSASDAIYAIDNGAGTDRQDGYNGPVSIHVLGTIVGPIFPGALGGDDAGRHFLWGIDSSGAIGIFEFAPSLTDTILNFIPFPVVEFTGLAYDGVNLYASSDTGDLYTLNPNTGAIINQVQIQGGVVSGLAARQIDVVGGEFLPIDSTALVLAGLQTSAIWMLPVLAGVAGSAFGILYIKSRRN